MTDNALTIKVKGPVDALPVPADEKSAVLSMIERAARDPAVDIDKLERLMTMQRQMAAERAKAEYAAAMGECQREMQPIFKRSENKQTHSTYATYDALDRVVRPIYTKHGFEVTFDTAPSEMESCITVVCMVTHKGGHERTHRAPIACDGKGAKGNDVMTKTHALGSALQYGRRYTFGLAFNVVTTDKDDDGNAAAGVITEAQGDELRKLMDDFDSEQIAGFCKYFKIETIDDLPAAAFERAKAAIAKSKAKRAST